MREVRKLRELFERLITMLDGPAVGVMGVRRAGAKGQSLIELALTTPLLFLMIVSTAEIGYLANNYLILLDALQQGGRQAVTQSPLTWNDARDTRNRYRTACYDTNANLFDLYPLQNNHTYFGPTAYTNSAFPSPGPVGFFDSVACQVVTSMDPLPFNVFKTTGNDVDDVVVSSISYINNCTGGFCYDGNGNPTGTRRITVTGRWPLTNRMCSDDARDPFNWPGKPAAGPNDVAPPADSTNDFRGFVMTGQNPYFQGTCYGSKFHVGGGDALDIETVLNNLPNPSGNTGTSMLKSVPNGGMVIVEVAWQHHQLFGFPPLTFLGNPDLYLYQMFPVSAVEPTPTPGPTWTPSS